MTCLSLLVAVWSPGFIVLYRRCLVLKTMTRYRKFPTPARSILGTLPLHIVLWAQVPGAPSGTTKEANE
jgi:hypothetical protein